MPNANPMQMLPNTTICYRLAVGPQCFLDANMLVWVLQNVGHDPKHEPVCIPVPYRLYHPEILILWISPTQNAHVGGHAPCEAPT